MLRKLARSVSLENDSPKWIRPVKQIFLCCRTLRSGCSARWVKLGSALSRAQGAELGLPRAHVRHVLHGALQPLGRRSLSARGIRLDQGRSRHSQERRPHHLRYFGLPQRTARRPHRGQAIDPDRRLRLGGVQRHFRSRRLPPGPERGRSQRGGGARLRLRRQLLLPVFRRPQHRQDQRGLVQRSRARQLRRHLRDHDPARTPSALRGGSAAARASSLALRVPRSSGDVDAASHPQFIPGRGLAGQGRPRRIRHRRRDRRRRRPPGHAGIRSAQGLRHARRLGHRRRQLLHRHRPAGDPRSVVDPLLQGSAQSRPQRGGRAAPAGVDDPDRLGGRRPRSRVPFGPRLRRSPRPGHLHRFRGADGGSSSARPDADGSRRGAESST